MPPNPIEPDAQAKLSSPGLEKMRRFIGGLSIFTLVMSVPQAVAVWVERQVAGVSLVSWGAYLVSAVAWLLYGLRKRDPNIFLPCIGWIAVDAAVITGVLVHR